MSQERFQSETGQTIDDNGCSLFFGNSSPLFYTVNPRSGISLRQQEQLGAPSILKSFRDLPGCTRLSSSLTNLDSASKRAQFPLLPDISQKGNMGKSLQGHHSSSKRFVRERYNPPFKVNAKIRHVYTQEVTTIEQGQDHHHHNQQQNLHGHRHSSHHHRHSTARNSQSFHDIVTCHRQTQTEPPNRLSPEHGESKQNPEVEAEQKSQENNNDDGEADDKVEPKETSEEGEAIMQQKRVLLRANSKSQQQTNGDIMNKTEPGSRKKVDASTSPIPSPFFTSGSLETADTTTNPFSGCSQMTVYPPLNYVRKLEDLEKITGHIVIQRFFTKTDDAFGTWLEKQLGMTTKSVSVDTSEFENAKTAELQDEGEDTGNENGAMGESDTVVIEAAEEKMDEGAIINDDTVGESKVEEVQMMNDNAAAEEKVEEVQITNDNAAGEEKVEEKVQIINDNTAEDEKVEGDEIINDSAAGDMEVEEVQLLSDHPTGEEKVEEVIQMNEDVGEKKEEDSGEKKEEDSGEKKEEDSGEKKEQDSGENKEEDANDNTKEEKLVAQEGFITGAISNPGEGDLQEDENKRPPEENPPADCGLTDPVKCECYSKELKETGTDESELLKEIEEQVVPEDTDIANAAEEVTVADEVETLVSSVVPILYPVIEEENNKTASEQPKSDKNEEDIDEVVRCTLEAYLMAPLEFEDIEDENENNEVEKENKKNELESLASPVSADTTKSEVDSGRADSIQSQENSRSFDGLIDTEGNTTSHDSVETVYEIPLSLPKHIDLENGPTRILQRCLSADSCIGTESSGDAKNQTANASQSSNDTIEVLDPIIAPKELADLNLGPPASAPPTSARSQTTKLPAIASAKIMVAKNQKSLSSARSQRSVSPGSAGPVRGAISGGRGRGLRRSDKTDLEGEDADGESETESEITDNQFPLSGRPSKHHYHPDGTDLELEEVEEDEGDDDDDRDAFDKMVANHLKYSRGLPTATTSRRSRLNRGTQTTKSIEPSTTSGSVSPCSSSNSSFDVEIISKSKRITTASSAGGGIDNDHHHDMITPSNMTLAWHESGRRRSYLPSSSSSLNLLNMKFSLGKDFESEVSIRMPTTNKSSMLSSNSANLGSASMLLPGSSGTGGKTSLLSSSGRTHHHHHYQSYHNRGLSSSSHPSAHHHNHEQTLQSPLTSATTTAATMKLVSDPATAPPTTELQSLWKDVRTKLDVQMNEIAATVIEEEEEEDGGLHVRGSGILPADPAPSSGSSMTKMRRNEEKIKRSLQRLKKILDD